MIWAMSHEHESDGAAWFQSINGEPARQLDRACAECGAKPGVECASLCSSEALLSS